MNQQSNGLSAANIASIVTAVIAAVNSGNSPVMAQKRGAKRRDYGVVRKAKPYAPKLSALPVDAKADRQMKRLAMIAKGFAKMGLTITFDKATGRFDNVKPYKVWLSEGLRVRRGQHGVMGLFHSSQCEVYVAPTLPSSEGHVVTKLPVTAPELMPKTARSLSELSQLIPA